MLRFFISDLHLQQQRPEITRALLYFLEQIAPGADELYLLGDIFEAWIGDDYPDPILDQIAPAFKQLKADGTAIYFLAGNRDFLLRDAGAARLSAQLIAPPYTLRLDQGLAVVLHGDELCTQDLEYQAFRNLVRAPLWQQSFLAKPIAERLAIATELRQRSKASGASKSDAIMDVTPSAVAQLFEQTQAELMIHGHTHRPARHSEPAGERIVLGDWSEHGWYLRSDSQALALVEFSPNA